MEENEKMTEGEARLIREIKKNCTYRRLAEIYFPKDNPTHGMQFAGEDLCREALVILYPTEEIWGMMAPEEKFGESFKSENQSYIGDFYWWE
jgi:hypothetical protein